MFAILPYAAAMKLAALLIAVLLALPVLAADEPEWFKNLPPMRTDDRAAFDKAAKNMYREECNCLTFVFEGKVRRADLPLSDADRQLILDGILKGWIVPFSPKGQGS